MALQFPKAYYDSKAEGRPTIQGLAVSQEPAFDLAESPEQVAQLDFANWLPFAAKTYHISPRIEDYILKPMPICPSDICNRNGVAFPLQELIKYQPPPMNRQVYKAWTGCPVHLEHDNEDHTKAYGVIFDTVLTPIKGYGDGKHWNVMGLIGIDKVKHPDIAQEVLDGRINTGSMGALADYFTCSVCGAQAHENSYKNCPHISSTKDVNWRVVEHNGEMRLAFLNAHELSPIEYSIVRDPAWAMSLSTTQFSW